VQKFFILIAACVAALTVEAANADTIKTFNISGTFEEELACVNGGCGTIPFSGLGVSGTFVLDADNGHYSATLNVPGLPSFFQTSAVSGIGLGKIDTGNSEGDVFQIWIPPLFNSFANFIAYTGGPTGGDAFFDASGTFATTGQTVTCNGPFGPTSCVVVLSDFVGTISPEVSGAPLPAALPLFAAGLGALGLLGWRRKRKAAALAAA
jgi:hypothetical protein